MPLELQSAGGKSPLFPIRTHESLFSRGVLISPSISLCHSVSEGGF